MKAQLRIGLQERGKIKTCSRAHVQSVGDGVQLALCIAHLLGQVLAQQAIGAFARATLPRHMRIGKEYLDREGSTPTTRASALRMAAQTGQPKWFLTRGVYACRQDPRGGAVR